LDVQREDQPDTAARDISDADLDEIEARHRFRTNYYNGEIWADRICQWCWPYPDPERDDSPDALVDHDCEVIGLVSAVRAARAQVAALTAERDKIEARLDVVLAGTDDLTEAGDNVHTKLDRVVELWRDCQDDLEAETKSLQTTAAAWGRNVRHSDELRAERDALRAQLDAVRALLDDAESRRRNILFADLCAALSAGGAGGDR
jgi:hypothetical protein